jgi:hypothetical protein
LLRTPIPAALTIGHPFSSETISRRFLLERLHETLIGVAAGANYGQAPRTTHHTCLT